MGSAFPPDSTRTDLRVTHLGFHRIPSRAGFFSSSRSPALGSLHPASSGAPWVSLGLPELLRVFLTHLPGV